MPWVAGLAVRVFTHEQAHVDQREDQRFIVDALKEMAYRRKLAGITIMRADEGRSDHGRPHTSTALKVADAPLVVELVDRAERIEPLLPEIAGLITSGVLLVAEIRLYFPATRLQTRDVMSPTPTLTADAPAATALAMLLGETRLIPVVAPSGTLVGVLTLGRLLQEVDPTLASRLTELHDPVAIRRRLDQAVSHRAVGESMVLNPYALTADMPLGLAARTLAAHHITRAPVVDAHHLVVGTLAERAIVVALTAPEHPVRVSPGDSTSQASPDDSTSRGRSGALRLATLRKSVLPGSGVRLTAALLADTETPQVAESTPLEELEEILANAPRCLTFVVSPDGQLLGAVDEHALLRHLLGETLAGAGASLLHALSRLPTQALSLLRHQTKTHWTAGMLKRPIPTTSAETPLVDALALMISAKTLAQSDVAAVIAPDGRPMGALWRQDALRALLEG